MITFTNRTAANAQGWNNTNVVVNWTCTDTGSGPCRGHRFQHTILRKESNQSSTGTCSDLAGNSKTNQESGINIDKTPPGY